MLIKKFEQITESELENVAAKIKSLVETPALIVLKGPVGAGKTTFTRAFIPEEVVGSPTYSIINEFDNYAHADLYRIKGHEELVHLELPLYLDDKDYFLVEWGTEFYETLINEVDDEFSFYELDIQLSDNQDAKSPRIFTLSSL